MASDSLKCSRIVNAVPWQAYRLPGDGRKMRSRCAQRKILLGLLAGSANPDGSHITLAIETMVKSTGFSNRTVKYILDELTNDLHYLQSGKLTGFNGTRIRAINLEALTTACVHLSGNSSAPLAPVDVHLSGNSNAPLDAVSNAPFPSQKCTLGTDSSAPFPGQDTGNPAKVHTTVQPTVSQPPTYHNSETDGGKVSLLSWKATLPDVLKTAPFYKQEKRAQEFLEREGPQMATAIAKAWSAGRDIRELRQIWMFFLNEVENFRQDALEYTPEGRAEKQRQEDALISRAENFGRQCSYERNTGQKAPAVVTVAMLNEAHDSMIKEQTLEETQAMLKKLSE
jgi:hypothetical protein